MHLARTLTLQSAVYRRVEKLFLVTIKNTKTKEKALIILRVDALVLLVYLQQQIV